MSGGSAQRVSSPSRDRVLGGKGGALCVLLLSPGCDCSGEDVLARVSPKIEVAAAVEFGEVPVGATKRMRVGVGNTGSAELRILEVVVDAPFAARGIVTSVPTGAERVLDVSFSPVNDESQVAVLTIRSNDEERPSVTVSLSGRGVQGSIAVRPTFIDFSNTSVGTVRRAEIIVSNLGIDVRDGRILTEDFPRPEHFRLSTLSRFMDASPLGIAARSSIQLDLDYQPLELGEDGGRILFEVCGERCGVEAEVRASAAQAVVRLVPPLLEFGSVGIGSTATRPVVVENTGLEPVRVTSIEASGGVELRAAPVRPLPASVEPKSSMAINLEYTPVSAAPFEGELLVRTNDPVVPEARVRVVGRGEGPLFIVQPDAIAFGIERQPATYRRALLLINAGSAEVRVESLAVSGAAFGLDDVPGLPARLASGESLIAYVTFSPAAIGEYLGSVAIATNDLAHASVTIPLSGGLADRVCELDMASGRINFGLLPLGYSRTKSVTLRNLGSDVCAIASGEFRAPVDPAIAIVEAPQWPLSVRPGEELALEFAYTPTMMVESKGNFVLRTGDAVFPERHLSVLGSAQGYVDLFTMPQSIDFGDIFPGCSAGQREVRIFNAGTREAIVDSISLTTVSREFSIPISPPQPITLPSGGSELFQVDYEAIDVGRDSSSVEIAVRDLPYALIVPLEGEGTNNPRITDEFDQTKTRKVDVLFVIDDSCSMEDDQAALAENVRTFIQEADVRRVEFQIGITTTTIFPTPGLLVGSVLTSRSGGVEQAFQAQANVGTFGSGIEQGLDAMSGALQLAASGVPPNRDLLRSDASLFVIIVSDEDDQSTAPSVFYLNELRQRAAAGYFVAVVSGQASGCGMQTLAGNGAAPAPRYEEFVMLSQGVSESICSSWANTLTNLGNIAFGLKQAFFLSKRADVGEPIEVRIDGILAPPGGWMYQASDGSIRFSAPPAEGAKITVEYTPDC